MLSSLADKTKMIRTEEVVSKGLEGWDSQSTSSHKQQLASFPRKSLQDPSWKPVGSPKWRQRLETGRAGSAGQAGVGCGRGAGAGRRGDSCIHCVTALACPLPAPAAVCRTPTPPTLRRTSG